MSDQGGVTDLRGHGSDPGFSRAAWGVVGGDAGPADRVDARLLGPAVACWASAALAAVLAPGASYVVSAALAIAAAVAGWRLLRDRQLPGRHAARTVGPPIGLAIFVVISACSAAGFVATAARRSSVEASPLLGLARAGAGATVDAVVTADPFLLVPRAGGHFGSTRSYLIDARAERVRSGRNVLLLRVPVLVLATGDGWGSLLPSTTVRLAATLAAPRPGDEVAAVVRVRGAPQVLRGPSRLQAVAGSLRAGLRTAASGLPRNEAGLLPGLVEGDTSKLPAELSTDFKVTGLTHLVAVSGSNVAAVLAAALVLTRRIRLGARAGPVAACLLLLGFVVLARPSASVLRAALMGLFALAALASGRSRPALAALSATVLLLVLFDPALAVSPGFALSTLASAALLLLAPGWRAGLIRRGASARLAEAISVPAAAQLVCGPVIAVFAGSVSLVAVGANLLAAPAVPLATVAGVLAAVLAPVSQTLAGVAAWVAAAPCWWLVTVASRGAALPGASVPWPSGAAGGLLLAAVSMLAVAVARRGVRRWFPARVTS